MATNEVTQEPYIVTGRPEYGNVFYNTKAHNGISTCIQGNYSSEYYSRWGLDVLRNCVGSASGAFNETFAKTLGIGNVFAWSLNTNAHKLIEQAKGLTYKGISLKDYILDKTDIPPLGGLIVWQNQHVAYICKVKDNDTIVVQQSGYGETRPAPHFDSNSNEDGSYRWGWREDTYKRGSDNNWNSSGSFGTCLGFIANPAVQGYVPPSPEPPDPPEPTIEPPQVTKIDSVSSEQIDITVETNGSEVVNLYIRWDTNTVTENNYHLLVTVTGTTVKTSVTKPRSATSVSVLPVRNSYRGTIVTKENLIASIPCINVYNNNRMVQAIPYVYTGGQWKITLPCIRSNGKWIEIWNDKK